MLEKGGRRVAYGAWGMLLRGDWTRVARDLSGEELQEGLNVACEWASTWTVDASVVDVMKSGGGRAVSE